MRFDVGQPPQETSCHLSACGCLSDLEATDRMCLLPAVDRRSLSLVPWGEKAPARCPEGCGASWREPCVHRPGSATPPRGRREGSGEADFLAGQSPSTRAVGGRTHGRKGGREGRKPQRSPSLCGDVGPWPRPATPLLPAGNQLPFVV